AKNVILVNDKPTKEEGAVNQLYQISNKNILGFPLRLHLYNLAKENSDSLYNAWLERKPKRKQFLFDVLSEKQTERLGHSFLVSGYSRFLKGVGEAPIIIDSTRISRSTERLKNYYFNQGYFNTVTSYKVDTLANKKGEITYIVETGKPYFIDTLKSRIGTPILDSLYKITKDQSLIVKGKQYNRNDIDGERNRITNFFRNRGAYHFQQSYINYVIDTVDTNNKANIELIIS